MVTIFKLPHHLSFLCDLFFAVLTRIWYGTHWRTFWRVLCCTLGMDRSGRTRRRWGKARPQGQPWNKGRKIKEGKMREKDVFEIHPCIFTQILNGIWHFRWLEKDDHSVSLKMALLSGTMLRAEDPEILWSKQHDAQIIPLLKKSFLKHRLLSQKSTFNHKWKKSQSCITLKRNDYDQVLSVSQT